MEEKLQFEDMRKEWGPEPADGRACWGGSPLQGPLLCLHVTPLCISVGLQEGLHVTPPDPWPVFV